mmetsp:Transcript_27695/g.73070  ORF Transcript_27695/g.73070 Transcript_27695/m.73070 type:complete len:802 (-) Transcript_27695:139-2544(-)
MSAIVSSEPVDVKSPDVAKDVRARTKSPGHRSPLSSSADADAVKFQKSVLDAQANFAERGKVALADQLGAELKEGWTLQCHLIALQEEKTALQGLLDMPERKNMVNQVKEAKEEVERLRVRVRAANVDFTRMQAEIKSLDKERTAVQDKCNLVDNRNSELKKKIEVKIQERGDLEASLAKLKAQCDALRAKLFAAESERDDFQNQILSATADRQTLKDALTTKGHESTALKAKLSALEGQRKAMQGLLSSAEREHDLLGSKLLSSTTKAHALETRAMTSISPTWKDRLPSEPASPALSKSPPYPVLRERIPASPASPGSTTRVNPPSRDLLKASQGRKQAASAGRLTPNTPDKAVDRAQLRKTASNANLNIQRAGSDLGSASTIDEKAPAAKSDIPISDIPISDKPISDIPISPASLEETRRASDSPASVKLDDDENDEKESTVPPIIDLTGARPVSMAPHSPAASSASSASTESELPKNAHYRSSNGLIVEDENGEPSVQSSVEVKEFEEHMARMERSMVLFWRTVSAANPNAAVRLQDTVKFRRSSTEVMENLGRIRNFMADILKSETGSKHRPRLFKVFGEDHCQKLGTVTAWTELLKDAAEGTPLASDHRLNETEREVTAIKQILSESHCDVDNNMLIAHDKAVDKLEEQVPAREVKRSMKSIRTASGSDAFTSSFIKGVILNEEEQKAADSEMQARLDLVADIDSKTSSHSALELVDKLFDIYDEDQSGVLEGKEYDLAIQDLTTHIMKKAGLPEEFRVKMENWVTNVVDDNLDGHIDREEARTGFSKMLKYDGEK